MDKLTNNTSDDYYDEHEPIAELLRQGKMIHALNQSIEYTIDIVRSFYEEVKADDEGKLIFYPNRCDPIDVTIYRFHQQMIDRLETIDAKGNPIHKPDYQFFLSNYRVLLELKQQCRLYISPQLWNDQTTKYVQQAYYLHYELRRRHYDVEYSYVYYEIFKLGFESPLYKHKGECANGFLKLIVQIREEFNLAREIRKQAEEYGISLPELPGEVPPLLEMYNANRLLPSPVSPIVWLQLQISAIATMDRRIEWLNNIQHREADTLAQYKIPDEQIAQIKYACLLLKRMYRRLKELQLHNGDIADFLQSFPYEDRMQAEYKVLIENISPSEFVALSQAIIDTIYLKTAKSPVELIARIPEYLDKIVATNIVDFVKSIHMAESTCQLYLHCDPTDRTPINNRAIPVAAPTIECRNQCFDYYINAKVDDIKNEFAYDQSRVIPISVDECCQLLLKRTKEFLHEYKNKYSPNEEVSETCVWKMVHNDIYLMADAFVNYLSQKITPQQHDIDTPRLPRKGKYQEVIVWLEKEKQNGQDHYKEAGNNRSAMCRKISKIVGWEVNENSLMKALYRRN